MADGTYYVNPSATGAGDGTSFADGYTTLNAAISARASSHSTGDTVTYRCGSDGPTYADSTAVTVSGHGGATVIIEGYTSGSYVGVQTGNAYDSSNCYALKISSNADPLNISEDNVTVRYLQVELTFNSDFRDVIEFTSAYSNSVIDSCRVQFNASNDSKACGIKVNGGTLKNTTVFSGQYDASGSKTACAIEAVGTCTVHANTVYGQTYGINVADFCEGHFINNVVVGSATGKHWNIGTSALDGTGTDSYNADPDGGSGSTNQANAVTLSATIGDELTDAANGDFTVASNGASNNIWDAGTSSGTPSVDIEGTARSNYSIGAYEYVSGGASGVPKQMSNYLRLMGA